MAGIYEPESVGSQDRTVIGQLAGLESRGDPEKQV
jgi:hypothetical protein